MNELNANESHSSQYSHPLEIPDSVYIGFGIWNLSIRVVTVSSFYREGCPV